MAQQLFLAGIRSAIGNDPMTGGSRSPFREAKLASEVIVEVECEGVKGATEGRDADANANAVLRNLWSPRSCLLLAARKLFPTDGSGGGDGAAVVIAGAGGGEGERRSGSIASLNQRAALTDPKSRGEGM
ncbi:hypothetical protein FRC04_006163 [Tulasnella sp. 424]|nr:hypothetical protein FRC04_006163 [Tulasnella sp. 424]